MTTPKYYYFVFGPPDPPEMDEVESGIYHPHTRPEVPVEPGDLLLLYCTNDYEAHPKEVPGIGVAIHNHLAVVTYRYLPFAKPISRDKLKSCFAPSDWDNFLMIHLNPFSMHQMKKESFIATVENSSIVWP